MAGIAAGELGLELGIDLAPEVAVVVGHLDRTLVGREHLDLHGHAAVAERELSLVSVQEAKFSAALPSIMYHSGSTCWRWARTTWLVTACAIGIISPTIYGQKDMGAGYCSKHGNYTGASCPRCAASGSSGGSSSSAQDQLILDAAGQFGTAIGSALRKKLFGDPQQAARLAAEAQARALELQREAEIAAAEAERKKQESFNRLRGSLKLDSFDGDSGGGLLLKGVDVGSTGGLALKLGDSGNELGLKLGDDELQPRGTQAAANTGAPDAATPNTDPMVVDLRNYQRAAYVATLPNTSAEAIAAAAQGDTSVIAMPPAGVPVISGAGLTQFQLANNAYRQSHEDGEKAALYFNRAQAQREIAGRELGRMKTDLARQLAQESDSTTLAQKHLLMAQIYATARAEHAAWVSAKAELEATRARESFDQAMLVRTVGSLKPAAPAQLPDEVLEFYRKGNAAVTAGDRPGAIAAFEAAIQRDPGHAAALRPYLAYLQSTSVPDAAASVLSPEDQREFESTAQGLFYADKIIARDNPLGIPAERRALILAGETDLNKLYPHVKAWFRAHPSFATSPDGQHVQLPQDSDMDFLFAPPEADVPFSPARTLVAALKPAASDEARKYQALAEDALKRKDVVAARAAYTEALEKYPRWPDGFYNAAVLAAEAKEYAVAAQHMRRYLTLSPNANDVTTSQDMLLYWQHKAKE